MYIAMNAKDVRLQYFLGVGEVDTYGYHFRDTEVSDFDIWSPPSIELIQSGNRESNIEIVSTFDIKKGIQDNNFVVIDFNDVLNGVVVESRID